MCTQGSLNADITSDNLESRPECTFRASGSGLKVKGFGGQGLG